ncbi:MAG: FHA domain-containing protein [Anaerolineales bacterium]|jgi:pSer/pThr/pTyr-binding forkhead associated (FHA) protein
MIGALVLLLRALLAVSLYAFLAWAFLSLWRDFQLQGTILSERRVPPLNLTIRRAELVLQNRSFSQAEITIGRDPACECSVDDDSISARHARLSYHHNQWWLEDLGSMNGTLLNQVKLQMPTVVMSEDEFVCGETHFGVEVTGNRLAPTRQIRKKKRGFLDEENTKPSSV